jgi:hypothetical protein
MPVVAAVPSGLSLTPLTIILLPLTMCKDASRTFSTYGRAKKVQEKSRSRRFWKYDVIQGYIKTETK